MGTNYYAIKDACPHCGHSEEKLHIGKSSGGWVFSLHVIPEKGINTLADWLDYWEHPGITIEDEYGRPITPEDMLKEITEREGRHNFHVPLNPATSGSNRYTTWEKVHALNHSEPGPNGLLRSRVGPGSRCVGHGDGTWSMFTGEFS